MVKLKIDNTEFEAQDGLTILDVATDAGLKIPVLCHKEGLPHYSSCMVCMVKDKRTNSFIPSCSALAQDGMDIDISSDEVISLRRKAIELLLSEHRAECDAPCRIVCPAGYNIPLMNRLLSAADYDGAFHLVESEIGSSEIFCTGCPGYCENACRRKKIDIPVSIRNMKLFISRQIKLKKPEPDKVDIPSAASPPGIREKQKKLTMPFTSRIGKLEPSELNEWLKECIGELTRFREIPDLKSASDESHCCMHCDCRAADNCRLRDLAGDFSVKDPKGKLVNFPIFKKINYKTGLIFENAKCIKCGLCVRLCEDSPGDPALCFIRRGFVSIISEPISVDFNDILKTRSKAVIEICPTGALSQYM